VICPTCKTYVGVFQDVIDYGHNATCPLHPQNLVDVAKLVRHADHPGAVESAVNLGMIVAAAEKLLAEGRKKT
jgi:hypothetical protein